MLCQLDQEVPQWKLMYQSPTYLYYHQVWVWLETCLDQVTDLILWIMSWQWEKWPDTASSMEGDRKGVEVVKQTLTD